MKKKNEVQKKEKNVKYCDFCKNLIFLNFDKYVVIETVHKGTRMEIKYYHFKCWVDFWNSKIQEAIGKRIQVGVQGLNKAMGMLQKQGMSL